MERITDIELELCIAPYKAYAGSIGSKQTLAALLELQERRAADKRETKLFNAMNSLE